MARIEELKKQNKFLNLSVYDIFTLILPNEKSKYIELLTNIIKNENNNTDRYSDYYYEDIRVGLLRFGLDAKNVYSLTKTELIVASALTDRLLSNSDIQILKSFIDYNERNLVLNNDITTYKTFSELMREVSMSELKILDKNLEKQVKMVYDSDKDGWLLIRPLTFSSSRKYGAGTKWCTTMEKEPQYFFRYAKKGILIYAINKHTGYKVAVNYDMRDKELSFWNETDNRIDSLLTELTSGVLGIIKEEIKDTKNNLDYLDSETKKAEQSKYGNDFNGGDFELNPIAVGEIYDQIRYDEDNLVTFDDNPNINITANLSGWVRTLSDDIR